MKTLTKIVLSMGATIVLILIVSAIFATMGRNSFWTTCLYNIDVGLFFLPCILIGCFGKKLWKSILWGLVPGLLILLSMYIAELMEMPPRYPPIDITLQTVLMQIGIISALSALMTSIGYGIQKMVDKPKNQ